MASEGLDPPHEEQVSEDTKPYQDETVASLVPASGETSIDWDKRDTEIIDLALSLALDELKESVKPFDSIKTRMSVLLAAVITAMAFLAGTALTELDPDSFNESLLSAGVISFIAFSVFAFLGLIPYSRRGFVDAKVFRDRYVRAGQEVNADHSYPPMRVKWTLVSDIDADVRSNIAHLRWLRRFFLGMLVTGAASVTFWALLAAYADTPTP